MECTSWVRNQHQTTKLLRLLCAQQCIHKHTLLLLVHELHKQCSSQHNCVPHQQQNSKDHSFTAGSAFPFVGAHGDKPTKGMSLPVPQCLYGAYSILRPVGLAAAAAGFTTPAEGAQVADCSLMLSPGAPVMTMINSNSSSRASRMGQLPCDQSCCILTATMCKHTLSQEYDQPSKQCGSQEVGQQLRRAGVAVQRAHCAARATYGCTRPGCTHKYLSAFAETSCSCCSADGTLLQDRAT